MNLLLRLILVIPYLLFVQTIRISSCSEGSDCSPLLRQIQTTCDGDCILGFSLNATTNVNINENNNTRVKRQTRNKKKKKKNGNNRNKNTKKNNRSQTSKQNTCLNTGMNWRNYQSFTTISRYLNCIASSSSLVTKYNAGKSVEGRDIIVVKVSNGRGSKPAIFIDGGVHAREWISPATVTGMLHSMVFNSNSFKSVLNNYDVYFLPVVNPDGYEYSRTKDRLWRKNRAHKERGKCAGIDLNRNFSYKWGGKGSSSNTCSEEYRGQSAFSEPESRAVRNFIQGRRGSIKMYLTFHSYGQMFLYPWGYDSSVRASDQAELHRIGEIGARAMGGGYKVGPAAQVNYEASGASDDWAKGGAGIKYSYTIELPDTGRYNFLLPPSRISGTVTSASRAVRAMISGISSSPRKGRSKFENEKIAAKEVDEKLPPSNIKILN